MAIKRSQGDVKVLGLIQRMDLPFLLQCGKDMDMFLEKRQGFCLICLLDIQIEMANMILGI